MKVWLYGLFSAIAAAVVIYSVWHTHNNQHDYQECARSAQIAAYDDLMLEAGIEPITPTRHAQYNQAIIDNQVKCSDLAAQWGMTDVAVLGYIAGIFGLFFLGITVFETQNAASFAKQTLQLARSTAIKELQAYLRIDSCEISRSGEAVTIKITVKNYGITPAYYVKINGLPFFSEVKDDHARTEDGNPFEEAVFSGSLAHGQDAFVVLTGVNSENLPYVHLNGYIEYDDIYGYKFGVLKGGRSIGICRFIETNKITEGGIEMAVRHDKEHATDKNGEEAH